MTGSFQERKRGSTPAGKRKFNYKKKCDDLWGKIVRLRDGECQAIGEGNTRCGGVLTADHIIGRANHNLRHNLRNGIALCYVHHIHWKGSHPLEYSYWLKTEYPLTYKYVMRKRKEAPKLHDQVYYEKTYKRLSRLLQLYEKMCYD